MEITCTHCHKSAPKTSRPLTDVQHYLFLYCRGWFGRKDQPNGHKTWHCPECLTTLEK